jgi:hypothetical protein
MSLKQFSKNQQTIASKEDTQPNTSYEPYYEARLVVVVDGKIRKLEIEGSLKEIYQEADSFEDLRECYITRQVI